MDKTIVCTCEDVSTHELDGALAAGMGDIESLKRYTGLGTGTCQGKSCVREAVRFLEKSGAPRDSLQPFTARAPLQPTTFAELAALESPPLDRVAPPEPPARPHPMRPTEPVPE